MSRPQRVRIEMDDKNIIFQQYAYVEKQMLTAGSVARHFKDTSWLMCLGIFCQFEVTYDFMNIIFLLKTTNDKK